MSRTYISNAIDRFSNDHDNLTSEAILIHPDIWNDVILEIQLSGRE